MDFGLSLNGINQFGDVYSTKLYVANNSGGWDDVIDLINSNSGAITSVLSPLSITNKVLSINLSTYLTSTQINTLLNAFTNTTGMNLLLNAKQDIIIAGTNITKTNNTLSVNDITTLNFKYGSNSSVPLAINANNKLTYNSVLIYDATEINSKVANCVTIDGPFLTPVTNVALGQRHFPFDVNYQYTQLVLKDTGSTARTLTSNVAGNLIWNSVNLLTTSDLTAYTTSALLTTLLAAKQDTITAGLFLTKTAGSTLNVDLSAYTNTASLTTLLNTKQSTLTNTTDITVQDVTARALIASQSGFNISANTTIIRDNNNTPLISFATAIIAVQTTLDCNETAIFRKSITILNSVGSLQGTLYIATGNNLTWNNNNIVTTDAMYADRIAKMQFSSAFSVTSQVSTGLMTIAKNQGFQNPSLSFSGTTKTLYNSTNNNIDYLTWGNDYIATIPILNAGLASQNSVLSTAINARQLLINANLNVPGLITLSTSAISSGYGLPQWKFITGGTNYLALGFSVTTNGWNNVQEALTISRTGSCSITGSMGNHSDESLKEDVKIADYGECQKVFDAIDVKTYKRNDYEIDKTRIGFLAQDFEKNINEDFQNLVVKSPNINGLLGLDYARITCVLWGVCKNQHDIITDMKNRLNALENK